MSDLVLQEDDGRGKNKRGYGGFIQGPFDYGALTSDVAAEAQASAEKICSSRRTHIVEVGQELAKIKAKMGHGHFGDRIDRALNLSPATVRNYMAAAREFAGKTLTVSVLPPATIYRLAAAPAPIRHGIVERIEAGEYVDREEVEQTIYQHREDARAAKQQTAENVEAKRKAVRRAELREQRLRQEWADRETREREKQREHATQLVDRLSAHFSLTEIAEMVQLVQWAGFKTVLEVTGERDAARRY